MLYKTLCLVCLSYSFTINAAPLTEREELTLTLNQLNQIETSLNRAQQSARTGVNERYYFDYPRIRRADTPRLTAIRRRP